MFVNNNIHRIIGYFYGNHRVYKTLSKPFELPLPPIHGVLRSPQVSIPRLVCLGKVLGVREDV